MDNCEDNFRAILEDYERDVGTLEAYLMQEPDSTIESLLWATKNQGISLGQGVGRKMWRGVLDFYGPKSPNRSREATLDIEKALYEICASERHKKITLFLRQLGTVFNAFFGLGRVSARESMEGYRRFFSHVYVSGKIA